MDTVLRKWGNSQGFLVPKSICSQLGAEVGDRVRIDCVPESKTMTITFEKPLQRYSRSRIMSIEEFAQGWQGEKASFDPWGDDVGSEVIR